MLGCDIAINVPYSFESIMINSGYSVAANKATWTASEKQCKPVTEPWNNTIAVCKKFIMLLSVNAFQFMVSGMLPEDPIRPFLNCPIRSGECRLVEATVGLCGHCVLMKSARALIELAVYGYCRENVVSCSSWPPSSRTFRRSRGDR